jgi:small-conductance mechanosensitive channel
MTSFLDALMTQVPGQWERVIATVLLIGMGLLLSNLWARYLARGQISHDKRRLHLVWARNVIWFVVVLVLIGVWASTIAGFALSLAAVAGALLIVSKELVMCVHGYLYLTLVQPFKIGDVVEFGTLQGRVIDIDMFATTLAELDDAGRQNGKVSEFPNGLLLTAPLRNVTPLGSYALHPVRLPIPERLSHDLARIEAAAEAASERVTSAWRDEAVAHFRKVAQEQFIDVPSGHTRIRWDFSDPTHLVLVVRVACPHSERGRVEQAIFKAVWQSLQEG